MNAANTMQRVYATLKERIMAGQFAPGERLDPVRLASDLASSPTPVRDALHRLVGERMIESSQNEGFRQFQISEAAMRDLYEWTHQLSLVIISSARGMAPDIERDAAVTTMSYTDCIQLVFTTLALSSPNLEHRAAMANLLDRSRLFQTAEARVLEGAIAEMQILYDAIVSRSWHNVKILLNRHQKRRIRATALIAGGLR